MVDLEVDVEDDEFQASIISSLRFVARERAIRSEGHDEGFTVSITADNIKAETERSRIKLQVLESYSDAFNAAGFSSHVDSERKSVEVFVHPVVDSARTQFSLDDISEQANVIREIRLREVVKGYE